MYRRGQAQSKRNAQKGHVCVHAAPRASYECDKRARKCGSETLKLRVEGNASIRASAAQIGH
eukprot:1415663-Pleurochrysis_carterae.AAC.1